MNTADPIFHKPKSIIAAKNILYANIFLGLLNSVIQRWMGPSDAGMNLEALLISLVTLLLLVFLTRMIGLGKKWARTVLLILFILGVAVFSFVLIPMIKANILTGVLSIFSAILQVIALVFLFSRDSTHWFDAIEENKLQHP
jgi:hypothetical protein